MLTKYSDEIFIFSTQYINIMLKTDDNNQFTYDYVKLKIGYFSNRIPVWEGIFTLENLT